MWSVVDRNVVISTYLYVQMCYDLPDVKGYNGTPVLYLRCLDELAVL
jgi:hypothetical protein